ncbi:MAG: glycosyltransferase family 4 protein [Anaerolineaceae bacterium]
MKIHILAQCYAPEDISGAKLITDLAVDLRQRFGHEVTVITTAPNYPFGKVFPGYRNRIYQREFLNGVQVIRTWGYISPSKTFWRRILSFGTYSLTAFYGALAAGKPDVLISYSPPLPLGMTASLLKRIWQVPWILEVVDLYPDAAVAAGILHNSWLIHRFTSMERFIYRRADRISVICDSFFQNLLQKGVPPQKIIPIPIWGDTQLVCPMSKENVFREKNHIDHKFVLLYAGNMGHTCCLEDVITAAHYLKDQKDIQFVLVGDGIKRPLLEKMAQENWLDNVTFLPYQSSDLYPQMLAAADVGLVTINPRSDLASLPSKVFNIMASARPVLAIAPEESDLAHLVKKGQCGMVSSPGAPDELANVILQLRDHQNELERMGMNGRIHLEDRYSREGCVQQFENLLMQLNE